MFSRDGRHMAYAFQKGQHACVAVDGQEGAEYDGIAEIAGVPWSLAPTVGAPRMGLRKAIR